MGRIYVSSFNEETPHGKCRLAVRRRLRNLIRSYSVLIRRGFFRICTQLLSQTELLEQDAEVIQLSLGIRVGVGAVHEGMLIALGGEQVLDVLLSDSGLGSCNQRLNDLSRVPA